MSTRYFKAVFSNGVVEVRCSPTRAYVKASWGSYGVSFHMTPHAAVPVGNVLVAPTTEIDGREYRAIKAQQLAERKARREAV